MIKGLVMEKHRKYMIVLTRDGMFQKAVPEADAEIGEEVEFEPFTEKRRSFAVPSLGRFGMPMGLAAAVALVLILAIPLYFLPGKEPKTYAYISIDINPSIELQVDKSMRVKELTPLNKDAETVRGGIGEYEGEDIAKVVDDIMIQSEERDLTAHGKKMLVGVTYADEKADQKASVLQHLHEFLAKEAPGWKVASYQVPTNLRKLAHEKNESANKLIAKKMRDHNSEAFAALSKEDREIIQSFYEKDDKKSNEKPASKVKKEQKQKKEKKKTAEKNEQEQQHTEQKQAVTPPAQQQTNPQQNQSGGSTPNSTGQSSGNQDPGSNSTPVKSSAGNNSTHRAPEQKTNQNKPVQNKPVQNNSSNSDNNSNNGKDYNEKKDYNQYKDKQIDYKNNNPYRNKDYNQYKNKGQQYRNNNDDDDDDGDD